eukprot:gene9767-10766_t
MEPDNSVEVSVVADQTNDSSPIALDVRPSEHRRTTSRSSADSSPYMSDSDVDDYCAEDDSKDHGKSIQGNNNDCEGTLKEKISRKSSMIKLTSELKDRIISQTEFLFSDENLQKDGFLLKHVKRNKDGFVNLKLLSSFKKMRSVCKDYRVICEALKDSQLLKMNEECTKIQRRMPLPDKLFEQASVRFVVVSNIKAENPSMDFFSEMFANSGQIEGVRIIRPGKKPPSDLQSHFAHNPCLCNETVAVMEFETAELAAEVVKNGLPSSEEKNSEVKLSLLHLSAKQMSKRTRHISGGDVGEARSGSEDVMSGKDEEEKQRAVKGRKNDRKKVNKKTNLQAADSCHSSSDNDMSYSSFSSYRRRFNYDSSNVASSNGSSPQLSPKNARRMQNNNNNNNGVCNKPPDSSPVSQRKYLEQKKFTGGKLQRELKLSPLARGTSPMTSPETRRRSPQKNVVVETSSLPNSPWITRRKMYNKDLNENVETHNGRLNAFGLVRQPKGPDGSGGFANQFGRIPLRA